MWCQQLDARAKGAAALRTVLDIGDV